MHSKEVVAAPLHLRMRWQPPDLRGEGDNSLHLEEKVAIACTSRRKWQPPALIGEEELGGLDEVTSLLLRVRGDEPPCLEEEMAIPFTRRGRRLEVAIPLI